MPRRIAAIVTAVLILAATVGSAPTATAQPVRLDPAEVATFLDTELPRQLRAMGIPGATASVVADGELVTARGYGVSDARSRRPVDAGRSVFPVDSVSKLLTATAALQLVERGELDLDTDVNRYLSAFKVRDTYPGHPVTLRQLLTHTAGFDETMVAMTVPPGDRRPSLEEYLKDRQPRRVRPPGALHSYSNYGFGLVGYLVQVRSGLRFEDYVDKHVFGPLGMTRSTFEVPRPPLIERDLARGHDAEGAAAEAADFAESPSGAAASTAGDMARFMLAHLGSGAAGSHRILSKRMSTSMHRQQFTHDTRLPGLGLAFFERDYAGHRAIGHGGDGPGTHSLLTLVPEAGVGLFVSYNGDGRGDEPLLQAASVAREKLTRAFVTKFLPKRSDPSPARGPRGGDPSGEYLYSRVAQGDPSKLMTAPLATMRVRAGAGGTLTTEGFSPSSESPSGRVEWDPVGDGTFRERGGEMRLSFVERKGRLIAASTDSSLALERIEWWQSPRFHLLAAGAGVVLLLSMAAWLVVALIRRSRHGAPPARGARTARLLAAVTGVLTLVFVTGAAGMLWSGTLLEAVERGGGHALNVLVLLPLIATAGGLAMVVCAATAWLRGWWGVLGRIHYTLVTVGLATVLAFAYHYQLAGPL